MWPFSRRERKESVAGPLISRQVLNQAQWARRDFNKSALEGYQQSAVVNACVYLTAKAAMSVPLAVMSGEVEIETGPLNKLLNRPNVMTSGEAFIQALVSDMMLGGECFIERVDLAGKPRELWRHQPGRVSVVPGPAGLPQAYEINISGSKRRIDVDLTRDKLQLLHIKDYHPTDDWRGMSSIDPAAFAIDMHTGGLRWNNALLANGAQPSGALIYAPKEGSEKLDDDQWARLRTELNESFSGAKNAGKPLLLDGGLDWKEMGFSPKDMNFEEGMNVAARLIALAFGVPPLILSIPGDNTFANYTEANKAFYRQSVLPMLGHICKELSWWLGPSFGTDITIEPDTDDLEIFADERAAQWDRIEKSTSMTINEKRAAQGLEPVAGGDVILISSSMIPLESAGAQLGDGEGADDTGEDAGDSGEGAVDGSD